MAEQNPDDREERAIAAARRHRRRKRTGRSLLIGMITMLLVLVAGFLLILSGNASADSSVPTCGGHVMGPDDECQEFRDGVLASTQSYQDLVNIQQGAPHARAVSGWWVIGLGLLGVITVYLVTNPRAPWGKFVPEPCPDCERETVRAKVITHYVVALCTEECGFATTHPAKARPA